MQLYSYWRSSCSYRVRIALGLKGVAWETVPVDLLKGEQSGAAYLAANPSGLVPLLVLDDGTRLTQSLAILDWLEAEFPDPALVPSDPVARARMLAATHVIAMDIQPLSNSGTINYLKSEHGVSPQGGVAWMVHFMQKNLAAMQEQIAPKGRYCFGDTPTWADICLIPQLYNAHRWGVDMAPLQRLLDIEAAALATPAFDAARPEKQPDAVIEGR